MQVVTNCDLQFLGSQSATSR